MEYKLIRFKCVILLATFYFKFRPIIRETELLKCEAEVDAKTTAMVRSLAHNTTWATNIYKFTNEIWLPYISEHFHSRELSIISWRY